MDLDTGNNARLSYRLLGSTSFRINPNTGWIYLAQSLDRETLDRHALTVLATDNGSPAATASASVLVMVLDDNDNDPQFEKDFYGFELLENLPSGTLVGSVSAIDPDIGKNSLLRYAVIQANSSFTVDPDTGKRPTSPSYFPVFRSLRSVCPSFASPSNATEYIDSRHNDARVFAKAGPGPGFEDPAGDAHAARKLAEKNIGESFPRCSPSFDSRCFQVACERVIREFVEQTRRESHYSPAGSFSDNLNSHRSYGRATRQP